jgi:hypothetical protein
MIIYFYYGGLLILKYTNWIIEWKLYVDIVHLLTNPSVDDQP